MQEEIDEVYTELVKAFVNLRLKPNKDLLQDLINKANGINRANYTSASLKLVDAEVEKASEVLNNPEATKEEVEAAVSALTKAMAGLIANPVNTNVSEVKTGDTTNMMYPLLGLAIASLGVYGSKKRRYRQKIIKNKIHLWILFFDASLLVQFLCLGGKLFLKEISKLFINNKKGDNRITW